jgi:hypothetical protein
MISFHHSGQIDGASRLALPLEAGNCRSLQRHTGFHAGLRSQKIIDNYQERREGRAGVSWKTHVAHVTDASEDQRLSRLDGYPIDKDPSSAPIDGFEHVIFIANGNASSAYDNVRLGCSLMQQLQQGLRPVRNGSEIDDIDPRLVQEGL